MKNENALQSLKSMSVVVADSSDIQALKKFQPIDVTTNPSLILSAISLPEYKPLIEKSLNFARNLTKNEEEVLDYALDALNVFVGTEILKQIPGRISTEINASLSFDKNGTVEKAKQIINMYQKCGVSKDRVLIKLASTWESIEAAKILEKDFEIHCNMTLLFSLVQAVACAEANATLISPFVGRILDWHLKRSGKSAIDPALDPGVLSVKQIYNYYKNFNYKTAIMGASFRNIGEIKELAGCDLLTINPNLLAELENCTEQLKCNLSVEKAKNESITKLELSEEKFRWLLNQDEMASEKLAEGIRKFAKDADSIKLKLREFL